MKANMNYLKSRKTARVYAPSLSALLLLGGIGCDGGLIGTGSGPVYELEHLPERISPDIPETLKSDINPGQSTSSTDSENRSSDLLRTMDVTDLFSIGWLDLNIRFLTVDYYRLFIETNSIIVDLAFDDILNECAEQLLDCTIPADQIRVTITPEVVNRLIELNSDWRDRIHSTFDIDFTETDTENLENSNAMLNAYLQSLLNKEVVLGETHYSQLDGAPYNHAITTELKRGPGIGDYTDLEYGEFESWRGETFGVLWHEDGNVVKFTVGLTEEVEMEYFYQNDVPSESVTINHMTLNPDDSLNTNSMRILGNDRSQARILLEATATGTAYEYSTSNSTVINDGLGNTIESSSSSGSGELTTLPDGTVVQTDVADSSEPELESQNSPTYIDRAYQGIQGQVDNSGGYAYSDVYRFDLEDSSLISRIGYRESFETNGRMLAGERCGFVLDFYLDVDFANPTNCNENVFLDVGPEGSSLTDSALYFAPEEFDSLAAVHDTTRWVLEGVPSDIENIAVVSSDLQTALFESEVLCRAVQYVAEDVRVYCTATDEQLDSTVVVELVDGIPTQIIPDAKLVQIQ